ncbi:MAG TPA: TetR/AcrR family transcriptional regulator, partial [Roseiflexaceae bacterium]|nr:TetR/AcrR family transcriptional regulator [Roseiflexaceae bacterium]
MSPRPYRLGERQAAIDQTRARIVEAARALLTADHGPINLTMEAVARQADVARMTVYNQFGSKIGLLEVVCDTLAANGGIHQLARAFQKADPLDALDELIRIFSEFWDADRLTSRRLRALAALDEEFAQVIHARDERRRSGLRVIVQRLAAQQGHPLPAGTEATVNVVFALTSFETFDTLAGPTRTCAEFAPLVQRLV